MTNTSPTAPLQRHWNPKGGGVEPHDAGMLYLRDDVDAAIANLAAEREAALKRAEQAEDAIRADELALAEAQYALSWAKANLAEYGVPCGCVERALLAIEDLRAASPEPVVRVRPLVWRQRDEKDGPEWDATCEVLSTGWTAYSEDAKSRIEDSRAKTILAAIETVAEADVRADERAKVIAEAKAAAVDLGMHDFDIVERIDALHTDASRAAAEKGGAA